MRKIVVAINVTLYGFCKLLDNVGISSMGRVTFQLMYPYWHIVARDKTGSPAEISFAEKLEKIHKILVSKSIDHVDWANTEIIKDKIKGKVIF